MTVAERGSLRIDAAPAAISTATAGVSENPGRCAASRPPAAPRNKAGNVGPPRKLPNEMVQARPLNRSRNAKVDRARVGPCLIRDAKASWPENKTVSAGWWVIWANAMARPPTVRAAAGRSSHGCLATVWAEALAPLMITTVTRATVKASAMAQPNSATVRGAASGLCKPAADEPILWQATAPEERRTDRAELRALLRYGWNEKDASAGTPEHSQATVDSRRSIQSELDLPHPVGIWYATRTEKSRVLVCSCASLAA